MGAQFPRAMGRGMAKLTQGIGRALRRPEDRATVWLLDPRFPLPQSALKIGSGIYNTHGLRRLVSAIPERFTRGPFSPYEQAECMPVGPPAAAE